MIWEIKKPPFKIWLKLALKDQTQLNFNYQSNCSNSINAGLTSDNFWNEAYFSVEDCVMIYSFT